MKQFFAKEVLGHPAVLASCAMSVIIAGGSVWYYQNSATPPSVVHAPLVAQAAATISASGTVLPSQNPDLYFEASGRVASVQVAEGDSVSAGQLLATLDTSTLSASRDQAEANLHLAQAKLDALKAGARDVDVTAKQTAVAQAEQSLTNLYAQVPNDLNNAYSNSLGAVHADTDSLYSGPDSTNPTLLFPTADIQMSTDASNERLSLDAMLNAWPQELTVTDQAALDQALASSIAHLNTMRDYANLLTQAVGGAITNSTFTSASVVTANTSLAALRTSVSGSLSALQADQQQIANSKLSIQSAQNALAQLQAPASTQDLEAAQAAVDAAQASVSASQAALGNATIVAPFSGTVSAVRVKVGDLTSAGSPAISLTPNSALEVDGYLSESDAALVTPGDAATITLDALGSNHPISATVASVDRAPTEQNGVPAYKVVLTLTGDISQIASGMTANISITPHGN